MSPVEKSTQPRTRGRETETHRADLNRSTAYLWFLFLAVCYGFIAYKNLHGSPIGHDELIYLVKSWWIFSNQLDWYSDALPLSYLPGSYIFPGLSQYILGQGLLEARFIGYVSGFLTLYLVFLYASRIATPAIGLLSSALLITVPEVLNWGTVSVYGVSSLLIIASLVACSDKFISNIHIRVIATGLLFSLLLFTRLNHAITVALLLPILYLSQRENGARVVFYVVIATILTSLLLLLLLPRDFLFQISSLGVVPFFLDLFSLTPPDHSMSNEFIESSEALASSTSAVPLVTSTAFLTPPDSAMGAVVYSLSSDLYFGFLSIIHNSRLLASALGVILIGTLLNLLPIVNNSGTEGLEKSFAIGFVVFVFLSFLKGHHLCSSCPVLYSHYFIVPGTIGAAFGYHKLIYRNQRRALVSVIFVLITCLYALGWHVRTYEDEFSTDHRAELAALGKSIDKLVPKGATILPVGSLGGLRPIRMALFLTDHIFEPQLLNPAFTFLPISLETVMTEADKNYFEGKNYWTPHHLLDWIQSDYDYIVKPTSLYYDDHKYRYWFRRLFYPAKARELIEEHFTCSRIPGKYQTIHPIDLCKRNAAS